DVTISSIPTTFGQAFNVTNFDIPVIANQTTENATVTFRAGNARGTSGGDTANLSYNGTPNIRIDTLPDESKRLKSGQGQYPTVGSGAGQCGDAFDASVSLATAGNEELQMYFGKYRYPAGNYTANGPVAGPNYTAVPA